MNLETERLQIRTFRIEDVPAIHRILDLAFGDGSKVGGLQSLRERESWVRWEILNEKWHSELHQPPYGEKAIVLRETREVIGAVGYVPSFDFFEQLPELRAPGESGPARATPEFGLFWAVDPEQQGKGYATEAARALIDHAFRDLGVKRVVATTEYDNHASQGVMRKLGMYVARNPLPDPPWLQVVGILNYPG